jgi:hypothetical protein
MKRFPHDPKLAPGSFFWWHTGFAALAKYGRADDMPKFLGPWHESISYGLSTFVEENSYWRSLCHAWAAHPNYGLLATVLGVRPASPGFRTVLIAPALGELKHAAGRIPHPLGDIDVDFERVGTGGLRGVITLPVGLTGTFEWGGKQIPLRAGRQEVHP